MFEWILFSPQPPHAKLWRECLSIGLLTKILLSFRSKTCLIFLSILLVQSLCSSCDHVRFVLSHDRSQLEDHSSERELFSVCSEVDAQMKEIQPSLRGSLGSNWGHEKVKLALNKVKRVSTRSQTSREYEEPVINYWKKMWQTEWHFGIWVFCQDFPGSSSRHLIWILFVNVLGLVRKESFCNEYNTHRDFYIETRLYLDEIVYTNVHVTTMEDK